MDNPLGYEMVWRDIGERIAAGTYRLNLSDLLAIYANLRLDILDPTYLPDFETVIGTAADRKRAIFRIAQRLWRITPDEWLKMERDWLIAGRDHICSTETSGKDRLSDVVSAEILLRLVAAAKVVFEKNANHPLVDEVLTAVNITLAEVCAKGRTRVTKVDGRSVYGAMIDAGVMIGTGGGKFLPYPEKSLPELMLMLQKERINPEVYIE